MVYQNHCSSIAFIHHVTKSSTLCPVTGFTSACSCSKQGVWLSLFRVQSCCTGSSLPARTACRRTRWVFMKSVDRSSGHTHGHRMTHYYKISRLFSLTFLLPPAGQRKFVWWTPQKDSQNIWRGTSSQTQVLCLNSVTLVLVQLHSKFPSCTHTFFWGGGHGSFNSICHKAYNRITCFAWLKPKDVSFFLGCTDPSWIQCETK